VLETKNYEHIKNIVLGLEAEGFKIVSY